MKKYLVFAASSVAIVIAASSALALGAGSNPVEVNAQSRRTGETIAPSNRPILMPSQTTQEFQLSLNQDKNSRQFLISQSDQFIGCGILIDPNPPTNVRSGPGTNFKVIAGLDKGAFVSLVERKNGWVRITNDSALDGWVSEKLVQPQRCP
jgi:uncharacterized protein YgiM (DUF1202 family)